MNEYGSDPFFQVPTSTVSSSEGSFELPYFYYEAGNLTALFRVDPGVVAAKLAGTGLVPGLTLGGKAIVVLFFGEYRRTSDHPYNEVGLGVAAVPNGVKLALGGWLDLYGKIAKRRLGFFIISLPVTKPFADIRGREVWGFPKFVTDIGFRLRNGEFVGDVQDPGGGEPILTLRGDLGLGVPVPSTDYVFYSRVGDKDLRTVVDVRGRANLHRGSRLHLEVGGSDHRMVKELVELGLNGIKPFVGIATHQMQARLNSGEQLPIGQGA